MGMAIKNYFDVIKTIGRYLLLIPFIPIVLIMMFVFSKVFEVNSKIPEDLENQTRMANSKNHK